MNDREEDCFSALILLRSSYKEERQSRQEMLDSIPRTLILQLYTVHLVFPCRSLAPLSVCLFSISTMFFSLFLTYY